MTVTYWITTGIESIGKMNPDSTCVGRSEMNVAAVNAICCVRAIVETRTPRPSAATRKMMRASRNTHGDPLNGTSKKSIADAIINDEAISTRTT